MNLPVTLYSVAATTGIYSLSRIVYARRPSPFTVPVFLGTGLIILALALAGIGVEDYRPAKTILNFLLGPASVALAVPVYKNRKTLLDHALPALAGLVIGLAATTLAAIAMVRVLRLPPMIFAAISVKSTTTPVAVEIARIIGADPALAAVLVILTGIIGATVGPTLLTLARVRDPLSRGLSLGTISHVFGTAQAATEGELQGAIAAIAIVVAAVFTAFAAPLIVQAFG